MLGTTQVPEHDSTIVTATGQLATIGAYLERSDRSPMCFLLHHALPAVHLPPVQHSVAVTADQQVPGRTPDHRIDNAAMPCKGSITCITSPPERVPGRVVLSALDIPHKQFPAASAA